MARRVSTSQLRSSLRQAQQKQRQAISRHNQTVNRYNQAVRTHNARVRANRQRLHSELQRLSRQLSTPQYAVYTDSVQTLHQSYARLEQQAESEQWHSTFNRVLDLSERETANSLEVTNRLLGAEIDSEEPITILQDVEVGSQLRRISEDLDDRWKGAVFALNPANPDAARHFCTSAREILTRILETGAPDTDVLRLSPNCDKTEQGKPTRRSKVNYLLYRKGMVQDALGEFIEDDIENIVQLFRVFNDGTHGSAGTFDFRQLGSIKTRVQGGITFLAEFLVDT